MDDTVSRASRVNFWDFSCGHSAQYDIDRFALQWLQWCSTVCFEVSRVGAGKCKVYKILRSAKKHGVTEGDMRAVLELPVEVLNQREDPPKYLYIGFHGLA